MLYKVLGVSKKLLFYCRQSLILFTVFFAISNRILINNGIKGFTLFVLTLILFSIGYFYEPFIYIFYVMYLVLLCESWLFAIFYKSITSFTKLVNKFLFNTLEEETLFSREYFTFFWGNMNKAAQEAFKVAASAVAIGAGIVAQRNQERILVEDQTSNATERAMKVDITNGTTKTVEYYNQMHKRYSEEAINNTLVLKTERDVNKSVSWFFSDSV